MKKEKITILKLMLRNRRKLLYEVWKDRPGLVVAIFIVSLGVSFISFANSGAMAILLNRLSSGEITFFTSSKLISVIVLYGLVIFILPSFLKIASYLSKVFWFFLEKKFEIKLFTKRLSLDISHFENPKTQDLIQRVREQSWRLRNFIEREVYLLQGLIEVAIAVVIIISIKWWALLIIFVSIIPQLIIETKKGQSVWSIHDSQSEDKRVYWEYTGHLERTSSLTEIKLFQNQRHFVERIISLFSQFQKEQIEIERRNTVLNLLALVVSQISFFALVVYFIYQVFSGNLPIGTFTFVVASLSSLESSISGLFLILARQYEDGLFVNDVFSYLDLPDMIKKPTEPIVLKKNESVKIEFIKISFSYPNTTKKVLEDFSLTINPGEKVALIGINGAGKTTLIKLLCRFYDPTEGKILINGIDLREIDLDSWYQKLGILFQEYSNYHIKVSDAIYLGDINGDKDYNKIEKSSIDSESSEFISAWGDKYEQTLGNQFTGGIEPSIGQWQKLALARSFYRDPQVLILDEPTSAIDAEAEAKIFEKLENLSKEKTVIFISHRFSTVRKADRIVVVESSRLIENGTHEELLLMNGTYARLFNLQAKGYS